jgi:hypothetical protein
MTIREQNHRTTRRSSDPWAYTNSAQTSDHPDHPPGRGRRDLLRLLNEDFARECQGVLAYAVFAERFRDVNPAASTECEDRGRRELTHAMALCQLVYDFGGAVTAAVDDRTAVRRAGRVARPTWSRETVRRLRERADQLRTAGRPHLANRLLVLVNHKQAAADLADIVRRHTDGSSEP